MHSCSKIVALALALVILAGPGAALAACWSVPTAQSHHCCMTKAQSRSLPNFANKAPQRPSCCELSSGKLVPPSVMQAPNTSVALAALPLRNTSLIPAPVPQQRHAALDAVPIGDIAETQAVLCTFLI